VAAVAREHGVALHLDGARLFMMSAATGVPACEYAAIFDTVYVSLYKYFGAPFGAILAGPAALIDGLYHERRMFGGGLPSAAPAAAAALAGLPGFEERFAAAMAKGRELFAAIGAEGFEHGSNIYLLRKPVDAKRLAERNVVVGTIEDGVLPLTINTSVLRQPNDELLDAFRYAAAS
jgi:threonine aldolase